jgi:acyl-CoA thioesterase I
MNMVVEFQRWSAPALRWCLAAVLSGCFVFMQESVSGDASRSEAQGKVVLVLGDSLAAGYGLDPSEAFPALLQENVDANGWPDKVVNAGLSGDTSAGGLRRLDWLLKQKVDVLVLELGGNDGLRGIQPETTQANLQAIIDRTRKKCLGVRFIIAGMQMPPNMGADYAEKFAKVFPTLAKENKALLVPFLLEGVGGRSELNQADRIHPTAEGQRIVADNVWRVLKPILVPPNAASDHRPSDHGTN